MQFSTLTKLQLTIILEKNYLSFIIIEHALLMLYEETREMIKYVYQALREAIRKATILLYASGVDPYFEELVKNADRAVYFGEGPKENRTGGILIRWPWKCEARLIEPSCTVNPRRAE